MKRIAVIGLGTMGGPMAGHLAAAGHAVTGYDPSADALAAAAERGIRPADSMGAAVRDADAVITMLPSGDVVRDVLEGEDGVLANLPAGRLVIDCSTIAASTSKALHELVREAGHRFVDAPVSGGMSGAREATLTFMVGGPAESVEEARPVLSPMGSRVVHAGQAGSGSAAKIINNMLLGVSLAGVCEAFVLAERMGLEAATFFDIATTSSGDCWALRTWTPVPGIVEGTPSSADWLPGFSSQLMLKDLRLAVDAAAEGGEALAVADHVRRLFEKHVEGGRAEDDCSSLIELVREGSR